MWRYFICAGSHVDLLVNVNTGDDEEHTCERVRFSQSWQPGLIWTYLDLGLLQSTVGPVGISQLSRTPSSGDQVLGQGQVIRSKCVYLDDFDCPDEREREGDEDEDEGAAGEEDSTEVRPLTAHRGRPLLSSPASAAPTSLGRRGEMNNIHLPCSYSISLRLEWLSGEHAGQWTPTFYESLFVHNIIRIK